MNPLVKYLLVLTIGVGDQDTTQVKTNHSDTSCRYSKRCVVKQARINRMAEKVNLKLDSINFKIDKRLEEILRLLEEDKL